MTAGSDRKWGEGAQEKGIGYVKRSDKIVQSSRGGLREGKKKGV